MLATLLILAADNTGNTQEAPDNGTALPIILGIIVAVALLAALGFYLLNRASRASKGGVEPPPADRGTNQAPPLESIERRT